MVRALINILQKTKNKSSAVRFLVLTALVLASSAASAVVASLLIWLPPIIRSLPYWPLLLFAVFTAAAVLILIWFKFKKWGGD